MFAQRMNAIASEWNELKDESELQTAGHYWIAVSCASKESKAQEKERAMDLE